MELSKNQNAIMTSNEKKIYVHAGAGAGKTAVLTERVRFLLKNGAPPERIACITFTNMAAQEMKERLGTDYRDGLFVGTIHSLAASIIAAHGEGAKIALYAKSDDFDKFFDVCKKYNLRNTYDYVLLDECQDISINEGYFIFEMIHPDNYFVVGDDNQHIYGFKEGCDVGVLNPYMKRDKAVFMSLDENFRCGATILEFAKQFLEPIDMYDFTHSVTGTSGEVINAEFSEAAVVNNIMAYDDYRDWAILVRDNKQLAMVEHIIKMHNIPYVSFRQSEVTNAQLKQMMEDNCVKLLTIHSAKGLTFNNVMVYGTHWWKSKPEEFRIMYVGATRARNKLVWFNNKEKKKKKAW